MIICALRTAMPSRVVRYRACDFVSIACMCKIRHLFTGIPPYQPRKSDTPRFESFVPFTREEVRREIIGMENKSCEVDQIDTSTLKDILAVCLPTITHIVNVLLTKGDFSEDWKIAIVRPLLK